MDNSKSNFTKELFFCLCTILVIVGFFFHTLGYPWRHFDEQIIYNETLLPIPRSFSELLDFIKYFGLKSYIEASSPFSTTISNLRCAPFGTLYFLGLFTIFQKNPFYYHLFSLLIHVLNSIFVFFILNLISSALGKSRLFLVSIFTLIWALHPANIEGILMPSNSGALITYFFCISLTLYFTFSAIRNKPLSAINKISDFIAYFIPLLLNEYSTTMIFVLFFYIIALLIFYNKFSYKQAIAISFQYLLPMIATFLFFVIYFISLPNLKTFSSSDIIYSLERVLWLCPQIFFHFLKLIVLPFNLSIDQSFLVKISDSLFSPYPIFCILILLSILLLSIISFFKLNSRRYFCIFILFVPFLFSIFPFLHIISPIYNFASERYLYLPTFFFIMGIFTAIIILSRKSKGNLPVLLISVFILILISSKTYLRTLDWKDSISIFKSSITNSNNALVKGLRLQMIGGLLFQGENVEDKKLGIQIINEGSNILSNYYNYLENLKYNNYPKIKFFYGIDPKTIQAKVAYLIALSKIGLDLNIQSAYELLKPHIENSSLTDSQILDFYLGILFTLNKLDEAEVILNRAIKTKLSPITLTILSELYKRKYKDYSRAEETLKESFRFFPYDTRTLERLKSLYLETNNLDKYAYFSYLHGLRTHSPQSLNDALSTYKTLYNQKMSAKVEKSMELIK